MTPERALTFAFGLIVAALIVTTIYDRVAAPAFGRVNAAMATGQQ